MQRRDIANILKQQHLANYLNAEMHIKNNVIAYMSEKYFLLSVYWIKIFKPPLIKCLYSWFCSCYYCILMYALFLKYDLIVSYQNLRFMQTWKWLFDTSVDWRKIMNQHFTVDMLCSYSCSFEFCILR